MNRAVLLKTLSSPWVLVPLLGALIAFGSVAAAVAARGPSPQTPPVSNTVPRVITPQALLSANGQAGPASELFLNITDIQGESRDDRHANEIDVLSFSWGESNVTASSGAAGGAAAGKVTMKDLTITKTTDKSSPKLMLAVATGQHFKQAVLTARSAGEARFEYLVIMLTDVVVSSYTIEGTTSDSRPVEQVALNFGKIEMKYTPQKPDGSADAPVTASWDVKANKGS